MDIVMARRAAQQRAARRSANLLRPLAHLDLSTRVTNALELEGVQTVGNLLQFGTRDLLDLHGFGTTCLREVLDKLASSGLKLREGRWRTWPASL